MSETQMTFARNRYCGTVSFENNTFSIEFDVSCDENCNLAIDPLPIDANSARILLGAMGEPGGYSKSLILEGTAENGSSFFSNSIDLRGSRFGNENSVTLKARKGRVTVPIQPGIERPLLRLWFRGFTSFRNPTVLMSLGEVGVEGPTKVKDRNDMAGSLAIQAHEGYIPEDWKEKADAFLTFMHRGLAFAHGGRLQTPRLDFISGNLWEATFYDGHGFPRNLSPIHHLNQGPFIKALAQRYDDPKPFPPMLWTAVGWLQTDSTFDEGRFIMSMTALETAVEHVIPKDLTTVMAKAEFANVRASLIGALTKCELGETPAQIFEGKLKGLNGRTLSQKIQALRDHYHLSTETFSDEAIVGVIKARNDLVHTGENTLGRDLWPKEVFVRELISMIVFKELGYDGPYESYIGGYQAVQPQAAAEDHELVGEEITLPPTYDRTV